MRRCTQRSLPRAWVGVADLSCAGGSTPCLDAVSSPFLWAELMASPVAAPLQDSVGNIVIRRPGSGGGEAAPPVIVQGAKGGAARGCCGDLSSAARSPASPAAASWVAASKRLHHRCDLSPALPCSFAGQAAWPASRFCPAAPRTSGVQSTASVSKPSSCGALSFSPPALRAAGHVDMVCEKNADVAHDFMADAIRLVRGAGSGSCAEPAR